MNTATHKLRFGVIGLTLVSTCVIALPTYADTGTAKPNASRQENIGVVTGFTVGAAAGGPVGAIVGATAGAWLGDRYHKQASANKTLSTTLDQAEAQRTRLTQDLAQANGSLADARSRGEKLDHALRAADEMQLDVGFRTNDDSISAQSVEPLMKMGALAASMPDMKVRVAGYADPRGSDRVNDELSRRRAETVAALLQQAGVPKDHLIVEGHGKAESTTADGDMDGYAFDRRVTVRLEASDKEKVASR